MSNDKIDFSKIKTRDDYVNSLYTPENIKAAGGIENFNRIMKEWERRDKWVGIKNNVIGTIEFFGPKILAIILCVGIIILLFKIF